VFSPRPGCSTYSSVIVGGVAAGALDSDRDGRFTYELEVVPWTEVTNIYHSLSEAYMSYWKDTPIHVAQ
jgi:hypothetical protein